MFVVLGGEKNDQGDIFLWTPEQMVRNLFVDPAMVEFALKQVPDEDERKRQMKEHGMIGRRYQGEVKQIISGSIGFDDWEWGVDLFAEDPLVFKRLI